MLFSQSIPAGSRHGSHSKAEDVDAKFRILDMKLVEAFLINEEKPFVVCKNLPEAEWYKFVDIYYDEDYPIKVRQLDYVDGHVLVVEMLTLEHECAVAAFNWLFPDAVGSLELPGIGSVTRHHLEPDFSYGPVQPTLPVPDGLLNGAEWTTFVLEVAYSQREASITRKLALWAKVPGLKYLLALFVSKGLHSFAFKFYYLMDDWSPTNAKPFPDPVAECQEVIVGNSDPKLITMDTRVLLGLRPMDVIPQ